MSEAHSLETMIPDELPVLPLRELVVFPHMALPIVVAREASKAAVEDALAADRLLLLVAQRDPDEIEPDPDDLYRVGTVVNLTGRSRLPDGRIKILVQGVTRARIESVIDQEGTLWVRSVALLDHETEEDWSVESEALMRSVRSHVEQLLPLKNLPPEVLSVTSHIDQAGRLADTIASNLRLKNSEAQEVLEISDSLVRLRRMDALIRRELEVSSVQAEIQTQARDEISRSQRENFLREQLRAIQNELGETDVRGDEFEEFRAKIEAVGMPAESHEESVRQLQRLERMHPDGPEAQVVRNYLDWMVSLPWSQASSDRLDIMEARNVLDVDHAHLDRVKDRILEFLSVRKLRADSRGPILCFSGPPGVGKTSLGRSIASAMGREFVRISLGGVRDEAELRGHRRTYVGAMPGRVIQAMKQAGTHNPVILLDEIDKLGADFRGDPSAALLEILDPEQNHAFSDHFLGTPFDLSRVLFIATANQVEEIPAPLRDRMEMIRLSGYTLEERVEIAQRFLVPRQIQENGLQASQVSLSVGAVEGLARDYSHEAGVRELNRQVGAICRKLARRAAEGDTSRATVSRRSLVRYLGVPPFESESMDTEDQVGVARGMAWTQAGGELIPVEATLMPGSGLTLTGQLGDVMKESAQTALSYVRSVLDELTGGNSETFSQSEVHIHVPAGATPKDGPSAGVTMALALVSMATGIPVRGDVAMTGEITLRGRVLAVGGVREKALAALRSGITDIIVPRQSMSEVGEIPKDLRRRLNFIPVTHMREVVEAGLCQSPLWNEMPAQPHATSQTPVHATFKGPRP
ncbi:MAG: endopeptidase La [Myxococcota bacterium]|nr:endopeptidase La [Myxococcota bacterium]